MPTQKEIYETSLDNFIANHPTLYGLNTKDFRDFFVNLVGVESTYRPNVRNTRGGTYKGWYQTDIPANKLKDYDAQHDYAFKHLANLFKDNITDLDVEYAKRKGISQSQLLGKYWNQRNKVTNWLWNGTESSDGNGMTVSNYNVDANVDITPYVSKATTGQYTIQPGDSFFNIQKTARTQGRDYNTGGRDLQTSNNINPRRLRAGTTVELGEPYEIPSPFPVEFGNDNYTTEWVPDWGLYSNMQTKKPKNLVEWYGQ